MVASRPGGAAPRGRAVFATHVASQSFTRIDVKKNTLSKNEFCIKLVSMVLLAPFRGFSKFF
jgi:hypothetical protein